MCSSQLSSNKFFCATDGEHYREPQLLKRKWTRNPNEYTYYTPPPSKAQRQHRKKCRKIFRTRGPGYILWDYVFQKWQDSHSHDASTTGLSKQELNKNKPTDILMWTGEISWGSIPRQWITGNQGMLREELVLARGEPHNWLFNTKQSPLK